MNIKEQSIGFYRRTVLALKILFGIENLPPYLRLGSSEFGGGALMGGYVKKPDYSNAGKSKINFSDVAASPEGEATILRILTRNPEIIKKIRGGR